MNWLPDIRSRFSLKDRFNTEFLTPCILHLKVSGAAVDADFGVYGDGKLRYMI